MEIRLNDPQYASVIRAAISLCATDNKYSNIDKADINAMLDSGDELVVGIGHYTRDCEYNMKAAVERTIRFPVRNGQNFDSVKKLLVCISGPQMKLSTKEHLKMMKKILSKQFKNLEWLKMCFTNSSDSETHATLILFGVQ